MSFSRYPRYKDSGVEWLGQVPEHWEVRRLKHNAYLRTEKAQQKDYPVGLENIQEWTGRYIATESLFEGDGVAFRAGDVLFGKLRPYLAKVYLADRGGEAVGDFHVLRPQQGIDPRYLQFQLLSREFIEIVDGSTFGSKMPRASWEFVGSMPSLRPTVPEQTTIANFLDQETAKIDALIAEQQRLIELLKEKRQAVISHAVTKGLNPNVRMKDSGVEWLGQVPDHWSVVPIKHVCRLESGHTPKKSNPRYWLPEDCCIPWVSLNDTKVLATSDFISDTAVKISALGMSNSSAHLIEAGAVVMNRDGARVGLTAITTKAMCVSQHIIAWVCGASVLNSFLLHVLYAMNAEIYRLASGATIPTIGMPDIREMTTPLPPIDEQNAIVELLFDQRQRLDTLTAEAQRAIELLQERRTALISAAVTGQIDVRQEGNRKVTRK